jgi:hypothetical protein
MGPEMEQLLSTDQWGPILWKYLHCIAERIGQSGNTIVDTDQANYMEVLLTMLPQILPCKSCQEHSLAYQEYSPIPPLRGMYGATLRETVRNWLFAFHNHVRSQNQQPIQMYTIEECIAFYSNCTISRQDYGSFIQSVAAAVRKGWVRMEQWKKWYSHSERIRVLCGNLVL